MGSGFSHLVPCFNPAGHDQPEVIFTASDPLDETLGHSFCYVRSSTRFLSPTPSDRFVSPTHSFRFSPSREPPRPAETCFKAISGASVSANTSTPRTVLQLDNIYDDATDSLGGVKGSLVDGFDCTSSFCALPLQPVPRGYGGDQSERAFFMSGPIELGALSGPLEPNGGGDSGGVPFSAPLGDLYMKKKRKKGIPGFRRAFSRSSSQKKRPWVVPERHFIGRKEVTSAGEEVNSEGKEKWEKNVQWALGKAGEDRVHVVVSEELGWLFVGIYDGFNGPDAPEFLMGNLYKAVYKELEGLFWDSEEANAQNGASECSNSVVADEVVRHPQTTDEHTGNGDHVHIIKNLSSTSECSRGPVKKVTFQPEQTETRRRRLWEFLAEDHPDEGLDLSGSDRYAFSVDDAVSVSNAGSDLSKRSLLLSKLKHGFSKHKDRKLFPWRFGLEAKEKAEVENKVEEKTSQNVRQRKIGPVDHASVLGAMSRALEITELAYLDMTDRVLDQYPELALMGSCLLAVLMRDEDVYVMNLGDSRAIVARYSPEDLSTSSGSQRQMENGLMVEDTVEEARSVDETAIKVENEACSGAIGSTALQLSTDHSTSIEEEIIRIKKEHPDDNHCIVNDRVKGRLKVTRAFGAGFLKRPKLNDSLLEMFRNEYIGTAPYISCVPSLCHHKLCPRDQFLVLSSDGLYQYFSNQEVVSYVENFMEKFPDGDPAQHLIEELLLRAAKKAGMDLHELLDIPQGDRRKYHDDVTVMVISLEGRIWKSSGKYL